jgi:hypothetical protein
MRRPILTWGSRALVASSFFLSSTVALVTSAGALITNLEPAAIGAFPAVTHQFFNSQTTSLACSSAARCDGVGTYETARNLSGYRSSSYVVSRVNGVWSNGSEVPSPTSYAGTFFAKNPPTGVLVMLASISCVSAGNCWSVGKAQAATASVAIAVQEVGGTWKTPIAIPVPNLTSRLTFLDAVGCTSSAKCVATGQYNEPGGVPRRFSIAESSGLWSGLHIVQMPANQGANTNSTVTSIKCFGALNCVAVGNYSTHTNEAAFEMTSAAGVFAPVQVLASPAVSGDYRLSALWCLNVSNCVAGGQFYMSPWHSFTVSESTGVWSSGIAADPSSSETNIESLSCSTTTNCSAIETIGPSTSAIVANITETSSVWSTPVTGPTSSGSVPTAWVGATAVFALGSVLGVYTRSAVATFMNGSFSSIVQLKMPSDVYVYQSGVFLDATCPTSTTCEVLGGYFNSVGKLQMYIETYVNDQAVSDVTISGSIYSSITDVQYGSISCGQLGDCAALMVSTSSEILANESNGQWSSAVAPDFGTPAQSVTCVGASWCILVGGDGSTAQASINSGSGWSAATSIPTLTMIDSISCWSVGNCEAVGYRVSSSDANNPQYAAVALSAGTWGTADLVAPYSSTVAWLGYFTSISCVSSSSCEAVGGFISFAGGYGSMISATYSNGAWSQTKLIVSPNNATGDYSDSLYAIKCLTSKYCVTVGDYLVDRGNSQAAISTDQVNGAFSTYAITSPYNATTDPTSEDTYVGGVGCMAVSHCLVVGSLTQATNLGNRLAPFIAFNGTPPPNSPTYVSAGGKLGQMTVNWHVPDANTGPKAVSYTAHVGSHSCTTSLLTCTVTGLIAGTQYSVDVSATSSIGTGPISLPITVTDLGAPSAPAIHNISTSSRSAQVTFYAPASTGGAPITGYVLSASAANHPTLVTTCLASGFVCYLGGVLNGISYKYQLSAQNHIGLGTASAPRNATAFGPPPTVFNPIALSGDRHLDVSWGSFGNGGSTLLHYTATANGVSCESASATHCTISGLTNGTSYSVTITATNVLGTNSPSLPVVATPSTAHAPASPGPVTSFTATGCKGCLTLTWNAPKAVGNGIAYYWICQIGGNNACRTIKGTRSAQFTATSTSTYAITVYARNGEFSSSVRVTGSPH